VVRGCALGPAWPSGRYCPISIDGSGSEAVARSADEAASCPARMTPRGDVSGSTHLICTYGEHLDRSIATASWQLDWAPLKVVPQIRQSVASPCSSVRGAAPGSLCRHRACRSAALWRRPCRLRLTCCDTDARAKAMAFEIAHCNQRQQGPSGIYGASLIVLDRKRRIERGDRARSPDRRARSAPGRSSSRSRPAETPCARPRQVRPPQQLIGADPRASAFTGGPA
jgi:hypothetical protein